MNDGSEDRLSPGAHELFRAARAAALPSEEARAHSMDRLRALGVGGDVRVLPCAGPSGVRALRISPPSRWFLAAAILLVTAGSVAAVVGVRALHAASAPEAPPSTPETVTPPQHSVRTTPAPEVAVKVAAEVPIAPSSAPAPLLAKPRGATPDVASARDDMSEELVLLGEARRALAEHRGADALRALDEDRRRFPNGALREERAYTRIRALCELGRLGEARSEGDRFLKTWPRSMYAANVRRSCAVPAGDAKTDDSLTGSRAPRH